LIASANRPDNPADCPSPLRLVPDSEAPGEMEQAFEMVSNAVALDRTNPTALRALFLVNYYLGNFAESERAAVIRRSHPTDKLLDALMTGLRNAGWTEPAPWSGRRLHRATRPPPRPSRRR
jgi:hypothetical protein